jgi:hypothetical protein
LKLTAALETSETFSSFVNSEIKIAANNILRDRFQNQADEKEALKLITFTGFMHASGLISIESTERKEWVRRLQPFDELLAKSNKMESFVPSVFFLIGLRWLFGKDANIPISYWKQALSKISGYHEKTAAVSNLYNLITSRIS